MLFSKTTVLTAAAAFAGLVQAQNPPTTTGSTSATPSTHAVAVGRSGLTFTPETFQARPGDFVRFDFFPGLHSVAQSTFDKPCEALADGFFTGEINGSNPPTSFMIEVKDDSPIWFFCPTRDHCQEGMSGVINPPSGQTIAEYKDQSKDATTTPPGEERGRVDPSQTQNPQNGTDTSSSGAPSPSGSGNDTSPGDSPSGSPTSSPGSGKNGTATPSATSTVPNAGSSVVNTAANLVLGAAVALAFLLV